MAHPQLQSPSSRNSSNGFRSPALLASLILAGFCSPVCALDDSSGAGASPNPVFEEWAIVVLDGKTCGYGSTVTTKTDGPDGPDYITAHHEEFVIKRLGTNMKIIETSQVTEDAEGGVLSFDEVSESGSSVESKGTRDGDYMVVSSRGQTQRFYLPRLAALGPEKIRRLSEAVPLKPGQLFSFDTFDPIIPRPSWWKKAVSRARKRGRFAACRAPSGN